MEKKKRSIFYGWWIVVVCTLIMATMFTLMTSCISLFLVPVTTELEISRSAFGSFTTIFFIVCMILSPVVGKCMEKSNARVVVTVALLVGSLAYAGLSFVNSVAMLYILAVIIGFGSSFSTTVPIAVLLTRWFTDKRGRAMSISFTGSSIGAMILSPFISAMIVDYGWRVAFRVLGLGMLILVVPMAYLLLRSSPEDMGLKALGADVSTTADHVEIKADENGVPLKQLQKSPVFWIFILGLFVMLLTMGVMYHMPAHVTGIGFGAETAARFVSIYSFIAIFGKLFMGHVFDKYGVKAGILLGSVGMALCFVFLLIAKSFAVLLLVALCYGAGSAHATIFPPTLTSKLYGTRFYGETFGFVNFFASLSMAINNLVMARAYDATGSYTLAWIIGLSAAVLATVLFMISVNKSEKFRN